MINYERFQRAILNDTAQEVIPQWASSALDDISQNGTSVAIRHPLGFVCLPVERAGGAGICVHVWSDTLPRTKPTTSMIHSHSWDLISYVLYGEVRNDVHEVTDAPDDAEYRVFEILSRGDIDEVRETPRLVRCEVKAAELSQRGNSYTLAAGMFHATVVRGEAATVALGRTHPGKMDLSLGGIAGKTHQVRRYRCDRDETAHAARIATEKLAKIRTVAREGQWDP